METFMITKEYLKSVLDYDAETGKFHRKNKNMNYRPLGHIYKNGYLRIVISGKQYKAHRLAWLYVYGSFPECDIDHKDGNKLNNSISNLREADRSENLQNLKKARSDNSTGYLGVTKYNNSGKFIAQIKIKGVKFNLGTFDDPKVAHQAYLEAKRKLHPYNTI